MGDVAMYLYLVPVTDGETTRRMLVKADDRIFAIISATWWCEGTRWRVIPTID
jgi:hypothetical protein